MAGDRETDAEKLGYIRTQLAKMAQDRGFRRIVDAEKMGHTWKQIRERMVQDRNPANC